LKSNAIGLPKACIPSPGVNSGDGAESLQKPQGSNKKGGRCRGEESLFQKRRECSASAKAGGYHKRFSNWDKGKKGADWGPKLVKGAPGHKTLSGGSLKQNVPPK